MYLRLIWKLFNGTHGIRKCVPDKYYINFHMYHNVNIFMGLPTSNTEWSWSSNLHENGFPTPYNVLTGTPDLQKMGFTTPYTLGSAASDFLLGQGSSGCLLALFDLTLCVQVNNLSVTSGRVFLGWTSTISKDICVLLKDCLAQGHN